MILALALSRVSTRSRLLAPAHNGYVAPVKGAIRRYDQGIDYQGTPGDSVVAIGNARVDAIKSDPGGFGTAIYYTLLTGPMKGQQIYVGHAQAVVSKGDIIQAGAPVATLLSSGGGNASNLSGWTEVGFARNGAPEPNSSKDFGLFVRGLHAGDYAGAAGTASATASLPETGTTAAQLIQQDTAQQAPPPMSPVVGANVITPDAQPNLTPAPNHPQETWQTLAALPGASPDTMRLASLAGLANAASG